MLKISQTGEGKQPVTLRLEGKIVGPWVEEVREACERHLAGGLAVELNLAEVAFVDPAGVTFLRSLAARGVTLAGCSLFVEEQLKPGPK